MSRPEFQHYILPNNINLHVHPTRKFKSLLIKVFFHTPLDEKVTRRALLPFILRRGSKKYPTMMRMTQALEELYGATFAADVLKIGERQLLYFKLITLSPRYALHREDTIGQSLDFLKDVLYNPLMEGAGFRPDYLSREKENLKNHIMSLIDDKAAYARERLIQEMCAGEPFAIYEYGKVEEIEPIDAVDLYMVHMEVVSRAPVDIFVVGHVNSEHIFEKAASIWNVQRDSEMEIPNTRVMVPERQTKHIVEEHPMTQAKLCMGFRTNIQYGDPQFAALAVANGIFGAYSHSRLFQIAREKEGLCYSVGSRIVKSKGLLIVCTGIDAVNHEKMLDITMRELREIQSGNFTENEFRSTVASIVDDLRSLNDLPSRKIDLYLEQKLNGFHLPIPEIIENVKAVSRKAVAEAMQCLKLDTVYLLKPTAQ